MGFSGPFKEWQAMKIVVQSAQLEGWLDGEKLLDYPLAAPIAGKIGAGRRPTAPASSRTTW